MTSLRAPTYPFSLFYTLYFALVGCIVPFWGLYLQHLSFSASDIGLLMSIFGVVRILGPNLWAAQANRFSSSVVMIRWASVLTLVLFSYIFFSDDLFSVGLVMFAYGFFWSALLPQYEALCLKQLDNDLGAYSRIRLWGSISFILVVLLLGYAFDYISLSWLPWMMLLLMLAITGNGWLIQPEAKAEQETGERLKVRSYLLTLPVMGFVLVNVLLYASHGPYYTFFSIFLEDHGYSKVATGIFWSTGVVAEVLLFLYFGKLFKGKSWMLWISGCLLLTAARWCLVAYAVDQLWILIFAQLTHAFTYAAMHAISMHYIQVLFPEPLRPRGQALYSSVGFGVGGALGAYFSGILWEPLGGTLVFALASVLALLAIPIAWFTLRRT